MTLHEVTKQTIILEEIVGYFMEKGFVNIDISIRRDKKVTSFKITVFGATKALGEKLIEELYCCRDQELEEYGLDVCVTDNPENLMQTLGMLLDSYEINYENNNLILTLYRKLK